ncbi:MAG: class I SAM-dependent methyltransferase [archaeon]
MADVCPVEKAGFLDNAFRRWVHNPEKILRGLVKPGMTVLDFGCGPGVFSVAMAQMVGKCGRVIAADLQQGMLDKLQDKIRRAGVGNICVHKCEKNKIGITEKVDFALAFYVVHEVPDQMELFRELKSLLRTGGMVLVVEPKMHVNACAFEKTVNTAISAGLAAVERRGIFLSWGMAFQST